MSNYQFICKSISDIASVYIRVYKDSSSKELEYVYGAKRLISLDNIPHNFITNHLLSNRTINIITLNKFIIGTIKDTETGRLFAIGPTRYGEIANDDIRSIIKQFGLPQIMEYDVSSFLLSTPVIPIDKLCSLLSLFNYEINHTEVPVDTLIKEIPDILDIGSASEVFIETADIEKSRPTGVYEETIAYLIKNGLVDEIKSISFPMNSYNVGVLGPNMLRSLKNGLIILNSICMRAAVSGGLDTETAYSLGERYIQRIENAQSIKDLERLSPMIRMDYCTRVHNLSVPQITNFHILKATEYVQNNIYEKITVQDIADYLNIKPEYLSALSKKNLGVTMSQYIANRKISEAKKLLRFTNKSLTEIANLLRYSSQSHFQRQFKAIRGVTPIEYRKKYKHGSI